MYIFWIGFATFWLTCGIITFLLKMLDSLYKNGFIERKVWVNGIGTMIGGLISFVLYTLHNILGFKIPKYKSKSQQFLEKLES